MFCVSPFRGIKSIDLQPVAPSLPPRRRFYLGAGAIVLLFVILVARFWHPAYGFTAFLQFDSSDVPNEIHEMAAAPVYVYPGNDGYDGFSYAEIAFHPLLDSPELKPALGNVPYRARRILNSALAWAIAGGRADKIAHTFAALNLPLWGLFALLCWKVLPVRDVRGWWLWTGLVLSAGVLHSVRLALTDLLGVLLLGACLWQRETGRPGSLATLAAGGLARETILTGVVSLWLGPWNSGRAWLRNAGRTLLAALPLALWLAWVRHAAGSAPPGFGNFTWPVIGWWEKWQQSVVALRSQPQFFWINLATLLALFGLSLEAWYIIRRPRWGNPWWRAAAVGVLMLLCFGTSVWEGNPGAAHRVLLPLSLAFAVLALRERASWRWVMVGNLSVLSGVIALWTPPHDPREIGAGRTAGAPYVIRLGTGWYGSEEARSKRWSWTAREGDLDFRLWPGEASAPAAKLRLGLRALSPREIEISSDAGVLWHGTVGTKLEWIEVERAAPARRNLGEGGDVALHLRSSAPPVREGPAADARELGFAIYNPALVSP